MLQHIRLKNNKIHVSNLFQPLENITKKKKSYFFYIPYSIHNKFTVNKEHKL